jgi:hypothetical protein
MTPHWRACVARQGAGPGPPKRARVGASPHEDVLGALDRWAESVRASSKIMDGCAVRARARALARGREEGREGGREAGRQAGREGGGGGRERERERERKREREREREKVGTCPHTRGAQTQ